MNGVVNYQELETFLRYLRDKVNDVYQDEVDQSINRFLEKQVTKTGSEIIK